MSESMISVRAEIRELSGYRCDQLMQHIIDNALPDATAKVISRSGDEVDVTSLGSLPQTVTGYVTTVYEVTSQTNPDVDIRAELLQVVDL